MSESKQPGRRSLRGVEWLNFFLADVQTGLGPFLAAYLAAGGWNPARVGFALTFGGLVTVALQTPAGAVVDAAHGKRSVIAISLGVLVAGALLLLGPLHPVTVYAAQFLIGASAPFLAPAIAAITLGIVGARAFDKQFGRNQAFNAGGNVFTALLVAYVSYKLGYHAIFGVAIAMAIPTALSLAAIDPGEIDYARARGSTRDGETPTTKGVPALLKDRVILFFLICAFLFHLANAAMLPQLGEMLAKGKPQEAAPFMSACIIVTQLVITVSAAWIGRRAESKGRKSLLLLGFGVLPLRGALYTLTSSAPALIAIQTLDGVANAIFGVVSILVIKDRTEGTGRFNLASGALATMVGVGAALSNTLGGTMIQYLGYRASFLGLATVAVVAVTLLWFAIPETRCGNTEAQVRPGLE
ncbi:MFS transporter [Telmatobacter sp. DSM 110680]|uniref:MFS transporter n=1 Tax=Telmatobacter sp. DSM 110680 TaxID=3036704 RepID=A0AAU7DNW7_9BACT